MLETVIPGARWVDPGNFHLTLRFIGEVDEGVAADIDEALVRLRARRFTLQLAGTGVFGGGKPRALWVGVERHPELVALRDRIEKALIRIGLEPDQRKFAPHVTLARLREPVLDKLGEFLAANAQFRAAPLPVEHFSLIASFPTKAGSIYEDQADYPLSG
jgi:2'-5' RNA ligase